VADSVQTGKSITYAELIKRDIFEPLGMNGSSFLLSEEHAVHMAFPEIATEAVREDNFISRKIGVTIYRCANRMMI
jgi:CubicO group peptidase (beta-lactamase class C family)